MLWAFGVGFRVNNSDAREVIRDLETGRFAQAKEPLDRWLAVSPDSAEAHYYKGRVALAWGYRRGGRVAQSCQLTWSVPTRARFAGRTDRLQVGSALRGRAAAAGRAYVESKRPDPQLSESLAQDLSVQTFDLTRSGAVIEPGFRKTPEIQGPTGASGNSSQVIRQ